MTDRVKLTKAIIKERERLLKLNNPRIAAIGRFGLDVDSHCDGDEIESEKIEMLIENYLKLFEELINL